MRFISFFSIVLTAILVAVSHYHHPDLAMVALVQLSGLTLVLAGGAGLAIYIARAARFEAIPLHQVLMLALVLRVLVWCGAPLLENDFFRYLWDAYRFAISGTPYEGAPAGYWIDASVPPAFRAILQQINYPEIPTIYGPVTQLLFLLGYLIAPGQVAALQALNGLLDMGLIYLLARVGAKPRWLLLYAVSPLVLKECVMTAHPDGLLGILLIGALVWARRSWLAGVLMGMALACKVSALVVLPFLWKRARWRGMVFAAVAVLLCYLPFIWQPGSELFALKTFARVWRFNPLLFGVIEQVVAADWVRPVAALLLAVVLLALYWRDWRASLQTQRIAPADQALGALLLLAPVVNAWYLLWFLPFAVLRPSRTAWAATVVVPLAYWNGANFGLSGQPQFGVPLWISAAELLVLGTMLYWDWRAPLMMSAMTSQTVHDARHAMDVEQIK